MVPALRRRLLCTRSIQGSANALWHDGDRISSPLTGRMGASPPQGLCAGSWLQSGSVTGDTVARRRALWDINNHRLIPLFRTMATEADDTSTVSLSNHDLST